jgi:hypothetical protein
MGRTIELEGQKEGEEHVYLFSPESEFYFTRYKNQIFEELRKMD